MSEVLPVFLTKKEISNRLKVTKVTIDRWRKNGDFPQHDFYFSVQQPRWTEKTINDWIELKMKGV